MELNWSNTVIKYILFLFNFLFVISGIILIAVGVSVKTYYTQYDIFLSNSYFSLPNLLIATGCLVFFISFFGCCGAWRESYMMIYIFSFLLCLIFILEFSAGIAGYVLRDKTNSYLTGELTAAMKKYNENGTETRTWDDIQYQFECCGVDGPKNWENIFQNTSLPNSCCRANSGTTGLMNCVMNNETTATYYKIGCVEGFGKYLKSHAVTLGGVGIAIAFIQLFGIIFAFHLAKRIRSGFYST